MTTVIVQHQVKDFPEWKKIFDADQPNLAKEGVHLKDLYTSVKNPNDITMVFGAPDDPALFERIMSDPHRQQAMRNGGVISPPHVSILNKA